MLREIPLKFLLYLHGVLTFWAFLVAYLGESYIWSNAFCIFLFIFSLLFPTNKSAVELLLVLFSFTILNDIICLGTFTTQSLLDYADHKTKFSFAMALINLLIKPVSVFFIFQEWRKRLDHEGVQEIGDTGAPNGGGGVGPAYHNLAAQEHTDPPMGTQPHDA